MRQRERRRVVDVDLVAARPATTIHLLSGLYCSWYGSLMVAWRCTSPVAGSRKKTALPAVSPTRSERPSGVSAMWCGSRSTGMRFTSVLLSMSNRLTVASLELITKASGRAAATPGSSSRRSASVFMGCPRLAGAS